MAANPGTDGDKTTSRAMPRPSTAIRASLLWTPLLSIAAAAFAVEVPFFFRGTPSGHDIEFHLYTWLEVLAQWSHGILYPRWASLAHFAYGEPRFIFYPPASWTLGAAIAAIFPWALAPGIYIWIALVAAGASMFLLARQWFDRRDAACAAIFYAINPYHLLIIYWRSAFAELLASSLLPLLLLLLLRGITIRRNILLLAALLAAAWLINAPAAVMIHYSLALFVISLWWRRRSSALVLAPAIAVALGAALAAFYLVPAIYEQKWVNIAESVSAGSRPADNFLFAHTSDPEHDTFNRLVSFVAAGQIVALTYLAWASRKQKFSAIRTSLSAWAAACILLMLPVSGIFWNLLPKLQFMQFPWRWLLCLNVPLTLFLTAGLQKWMPRIAIYLSMVCVLILAGRHFQPPWWDSADDLREMKENITTGAGYEGTDEYAPLGADPSVIDKSARRVTVDGPAHAAIHVLDWQAESKTFTAQMSAGDRLALRLFNYPAWRVAVNGRPIKPSTREDTGRMLIPVEAGMNRVELRFVRTWDRALGAWISLLAVFLAIILWRLPTTGLTRETDT
ncbi:MAG TPA: 6-pyruvoyl-tetrahydropterin synthase-related protein [Candidatus Binatia bacterium]|nr:6-pyruvoyl-tetrahydropterin synthase-related protein [Candidatus Binatia bacterium]